VIIARRGFLLGLVSLIAAPAIVRIENIMPVRALKFTGPWLDVIGADGKTERLRDADDETVRKILASQLVIVR
jgi:hypothetical protein